MSSQSDVKIDPDNYTVLITDQGGAFYNNNDKTKAIPFKADQLKEVVYGRNGLTAGSGLLFPVTRYFNGNFSSFIIERPPQEITLSIISDTYMKGKSTRYKLPWTSFYFELDEKFKFVKIQLFFRPMNAVTKHDILYRYPIPLTDVNGVVYDSIVDSINNNIELIDDVNMKIYSLFESFFRLFNSFLSVKDSEVNEDVLPDAFTGNNLKTYTHLSQFLKEVPLEKLVLLDYKPFKTKVNDGLDFDASGSDLNYMRIIDHINNQNEEKHISFIDVIKQVLNLT